jgi:hypothetical protein
MTAVTFVYIIITTMAVLTSDSPYETANRISHSQLHNLLGMFLPPITIPFSESLSQILPNGAKIIKISAGWPLNMAISLGDITRDLIDLSYKITGPETAVSDTYAFDKGVRLEPVFNKPYNLVNAVTRGGHVRLRFIRNTGVWERGPIGYNIITCDELGKYDRLKIYFS